MSGTTYQIAPKELQKFCKEVIVQHHGDLDSADAKVDILLAFRDPEKEAPALSREGHRILGTSKVITLKDRVKGMGDCEIILDGDEWGAMSPQYQEALLDHQLEHFEVKRDKDGSFIFDDLNRPVIKIRPPDRVIRIFDSVASRYRDASLEMRQLRLAMSAETQP